MAGQPDSAALVAGLTAAVDGWAGFDPAGRSGAELGGLLVEVERQCNRLEAVRIGLTAAFDAVDGARATGHRNTQHFLQDRLRLAPGAAKKRADTARRLAEGLPETGQALADGDINLEQAAAIAHAAARIARAQRAAAAAEAEAAGAAEADAAAAAEAAPAGRAAPSGDDQPGGTADGGHGERGGRSGMPTPRPGDAGGGTGDEDPATRAEGSLLAAARDGDAGQVRRTGQRLAAQADRAGDHEARARTAYAQRRFSVRHDGETTWLEGRLHQAGGERLAARLHALAAPAGPHDDRDHGQRMADALVELADLGPGDGSSGRQGSSGGVVAVVPIDTIEARAGAAPGSLTWSGPCPPSGIEEAICAAGLSWLITDPDGLPLAYGRSRRFATEAQRGALAVRDGGCRWPGCTSKPLFTIAHHEPPYGQDGWATDLDRMALLCGFHHGLRHHAGWRLDLDADATVTVTSRDGATVLTETAEHARSRHHAVTLQGGRTGRHVANERTHHHHRRRRAPGRQVGLPGMAGEAAGNYLTGGPAGDTSRPRDGPRRRERAAMAVGWDGVQSARERVADLAEVC